MIVDDHHGLVAILGAELGGELRPRPPLYLDARIPTILHLRLVCALNKPGVGRLTQHIRSRTFDPAQRAALLDAIAVPRRGAIDVLDDRPLAAAIGALTAERGVPRRARAVFGPAGPHRSRERGPWTEVATRRGIEVIAQPATLR